MSVKIFRLAFKWLWNSEYTMFVSQLVKIMEKYPVEALHLLKSYSRITAMGPQLEKIRAQETGSLLSRTLQELDMQRDTLFNSILTQVRAMRNVGMPSIEAPVKVLDHFFDSVGRDIASAGYNAETKRLNDLMVDYDSAAEIKSAAQALNLHAFFEQLREVNTTFAAKFMERTQEDALVEKVDSNAIRSETDKLLIAFFNAFEFCSSEYDKLDYNTPANELNNLIAYYKAQVKARTTRHNAGKDENPASPES
ncbi:MAG: DUF6261 family protein [Bacteroidota bacterium]